jgi:hypothetical protein
VGDVALFAGTFNFLDELLDEHELRAVLLAKMLFALVGGLDLTVFGAQAHGGDFALRSPTKRIKPGVWFGWARAEFFWADRETATILEPCPKML